MSIRISSLCFSNIWLGDCYHLSRDNLGNLDCPVEDCSTQFEDIRKLKTHLKSVHGAASISHRSVEGGVVVPPPSAAGFVPLPSSHISSMDHSGRTPGIGPSPPRLHTSGTPSLSLATPSSSAAGPSRTRQLSVRLQPYARPSTPQAPDLAPMLPIRVSSPPVPMQVDTAPARLSPSAPPQNNTKSCLVSTPFLARFSLRYHSHYKTLHCMICLTAQLEGAIGAHLRDKHQMSWSKADTGDLRSFVASNPVADFHSIKSPMSGGLPVEGLALVSTGHACIACNACYQNMKTFRNHWALHHKDHPSAVESAFTMCTVQSFLHRSKGFFQVEPRLSVMSATDPFYLFLSKNVPVFEAETDIAQAVQAKDTPPLLQITGWHEHLAEYLSSKPKLEALLRLKVLPGVKDTSPLGNLRWLVRDYVKDIRSKNSNASMNVRCGLMQYPRLGFPFTQFQVSNPFMLGLKARTIGGEHTEMIKHSTTMLQHFTTLYMHCC